ncbi:MAG: metal ABC transporter ATP-binding protein [Tepidisphaera sp.]
MKEPKQDVAVVYESVSYAYPHAPADQGRASRQGVAVESLTFTVRAGERLGILGPNGGGKSTLLRLTLGMMEPTSGKISVFGVSPREARRARLVGYVPQRSEAETAFPLCVREVVTMAATVGLSPWRSVSTEAKAHVGRCLALVGAEDLAERHIGGLSGGQMQRVLMARALAASPKLLLLDEPTVGIDASGQKQFAEMLQRVQSELGVTVIIVSHDLRTVAAGCDRVACLSRTLHFHAAPAGLTPAVLAEVFRHDVSAIFGDIHIDAHQAAGCSGHHHAPSEPITLSVSDVSRRAAKGGDRP